MSRAVLAGLLMCVLALVGCAAVMQLTELQAELDAAGYGNTDINHNTTNGHDTLAVDALMPNDVPNDANATEIAEIVWTRYPGEFDELVISINGEVFVEASAAELADQLGERPVRENNGGTNVTAIVVVVVVALVFAGLMVLLWWRGRRPPPPVAAPATPQMPNPYQQPPQGWPLGPNWPG
jgi:hypothetical protein